MIREKILVIGACGQIGVELTLELRKIYGGHNVIASDLRAENDLLKGTGPYVSLDVMNKEMLHVQVFRKGVTRIPSIHILQTKSFMRKPVVKRVTSLHHLQNIYYMMNGKDLVFNEAVI